MNWSNSMKSMKFRNMYLISSLLVQTEEELVLHINATDQKLYSMPFIGMSEEDAVLVADSFTDFMERFEKEEIEIY